MLTLICDLVSLLTFGGAGFLNLSSDLHESPQATANTTHVTRNEVQTPMSYVACGLRVVGSIESFVLLCVVPLIELYDTSCSWAGDTAHRVREHVSRNTASRELLSTVYNIQSISC